MRNAFFKVLSWLGISTHRRMRLTIRFIALIFVLFSAYKVNELLAKLQFNTAWWFFLGLTVAAIVEFVFGDVLADRYFPFDTERKLAIMEQRLTTEAIARIRQRLGKMINDLRGCDNHLVSATVHIPILLSATFDQTIREGLLQLTDYVGSAKGRKGRVTLITQGVIGRCARTLKNESVNFTDTEQYQDSMVREFGYTYEEAKRHTIAARSYHAIPILDESHGRLVAVLYFFSQEPQVFPRALDLEKVADCTDEIRSLIKLTRLD